MFQTANGSTSTSDVAKIVVDELGETVEPHVLDETPTVLSVGRRCMKMGYAFHWMPGKLPFMVTPKQGFVHLQVKDDIPYLVSDGKLRSNRHRPYDRRPQRTFFGSTGDGNERRGKSGR